MGLQKVCVCVCVRAVEVGLTSPQSKRKMPYLDRFSGLSCSRGASTICCPLSVSTIFCVYESM